MPRDTVIAVLVFVSARGIASGLCESRWREISEYYKLFAPDLINKKCIFSQSIINLDIHQMSGRINSSDGGPLYSQADAAQKFTFAFKTPECYLLPSVVITL